jgi:hypothetical protein
MVLSREEKENMVLDLYYSKGYTYKQLTKELRMSPNQLREIIKRNEEKNGAIANKKKELSLSSQAYKLFYEGKTNVEVAIKLDLPQVQVTQFRLEYWRLQNQDKFESLYTVTKGRVSSLWKLYRELVIDRGMSIEAVANVVDIDLNKLPEMERLLEQTEKSLARKQVDIDIIKDRIRSLEEEEKRKRRIVTLPPSSYYVNNSAPNSLPYNYYSASCQPPSLPYQPSGSPDLTNDFRDAQKYSKEKEKIHGWYEGDIAD